MRSSVEMVGVCSDLAGGRTPFDCWRHVSRIRIEPISVLRGGYESAAVTAWYVQALCELSQVGSVFVALSGVGLLPWFEFRLPGGSTGLAKYFMSLSIRSMLVSDGVRCVSYHTGEQGCTAKVFELTGVAVGGAQDAEPGAAADGGGTQVPRALKLSGPRRG